ncbi:MaoC family dehydratase N-terminal domain-containing protein [Microbispora hainanensis]|jgi:acyl dehydratase|uniref:MaoC family dehydratase N-terminal domain-containing protein n=1 Tax=Microbispora hainanensis TaxID=568844 RepID=A0ABZ1SV02_9ACTN|nr:MULTISPECIES: MaoC family dehydratase N-terminal domain-containing protein [Microbispora]NJP23051.1 MaoC family dehydratase [Microbispora sp. CL1-1]TQS17054.1 MaoC family dehydratase [Microbispora sp. SCL1-1]
MPLNAALVGRVYPATDPYLVSREKIREFARAIGDSGDPACAPPTFAVVVTMPAELRVVFDPEVGFDTTRLLHREQRFEHRRPIEPGDELTVTVTVAEAGHVGGTDVLTLSSVVRTTEDELVCTGTSTLIARSDG